MRHLLSYTRIQTVIGALVRNRRFQLRRKRLASRGLLNVGCGRNTNSSFINLDYAWTREIDVCWDIRISLPFGSERFDGVYTEHCLEHLTFEDCVRALEEFHRVLAPGGTLRIIVPDGGLYLDLYQESRGRDVTFPYIDDIGRQDFERDSRYGFTPMMAVNRIFRGYGHLFAYDFETLAKVLSAIGFSQVTRCAFRCGRKQELLMDSELRRPQSLFAEAIKSAT